MRFLLNLLAQIALAAVALVVIHFALPGVTLHLAGFFIALGVFTIAYAILRPLVRKLAQRYAEPLTGGVGLIATLLALWIATLFKGALSSRACRPGCLRQRSCGSSPRSAAGSSASS